MWNDKVLNDFWYVPIVVFELNIISFIYNLHIPYNPNPHLINKIIFSKYNSQLYNKKQFPIKPPNGQQTEIIVTNKNKINFHYY